MIKSPLIAIMLFLLAACNPNHKNNNSDNPNFHTDSLSDQPKPGSFINKTETLLRVDKFNAAFRDPYFKSLDFKPSYWISAACFNALSDKMNSGNLSGIKIYFGATAASPHSTSIQWVATKELNRDNISDFNFRFKLNPGLNPESFGIDLDKAQAQTSRQNFALYYRLQNPSDLSAGAQASLDSVSASCWFDKLPLTNISDQIKSNNKITGLRLYIGAYYNGKDDGQKDRKYDVQTTLQIVATKTDANTNATIDDWEFLQEPPALVLNHGTLCPTRCN